MTDQFINHINGLPMTDACTKNHVEQKSIDRGIQDTLPEEELAPSVSRHRERIEMASELQMSSRRRRREEGGGGSGYVQVELGDLKRLEGCPERAAASQKRVGDIGCIRSPV